jgi:hypothetical protein
LEDNNAKINRINSQTENADDKQGSNQVIQEIQAELDNLLSFIQEFSIEKSPLLTLKVNSRRRSSCEGSTSLSPTSTTFTTAKTTTSPSKSVASEERAKDSREGDHLSGSITPSNTSTCKRSSWLSKRSSLGSLLFADSLHQHRQEYQKDVQSPESPGNGCHSKASRLPLAIATSQESNQQETRGCVINISKKPTPTTPDEEVCNNARILAAELKQQLFLGRNKVINSVTKHKKKAPQPPSAISCYSTTATTRGDQCFLVSYIELILTVYFDNNLYSGSILLCSYTRDGQEIATLERRAADASTIRSAWDSFGEDEGTHNETIDVNKAGKGHQTVERSISIPNSVYSFKALPMEKSDSFPDRIKENLTERGNKIKMKLERDHDFQVYDWKTNARSLDNESTAEATSEVKTAVYEKIVMFKRVIKSRDAKSDQEMKDILDSIICHYQ